MRVLVVDDDYVSRVKLKTLLAEYGDCDAVPNGRLAMSMFKAAHEELFPYDLITMDVDMPDLKGQTVVQAMRKWEDENNVAQESKEVKILMISYMDDAQNILSSFKKGAEWYLKKPVNQDNIRQALKKMELLCT